MAGDWIKMETTLHEKPEVIQIAAELGMDRYSVVGRLHRLWSWFNAQSRDGHAKGVTDVFVDELLSCDGFARMLRKVDWLEVRSGSLLVPHFNRHNGESAKKRAVQNERKRRERKSRSEGDKCHAPSVTDRGQNDDQRREEKRRENNTLSPLMSNSNFAKSWKRWRKHLNEKFKPLTETTEEGQLIELGRVCSDDPNDASALVEFTISRGALNLITSGEHKQEKKSQTQPRRSMYD